MKKIIKITIVIILLVSIYIPVFAEDNIFNIDKNTDITNISIDSDKTKILIDNTSIDDLSFLNNYKDKEIEINNSTVNINNLDSDLINKINYKNTYIKGEFNSNYINKTSDSIINTEYNYNKKYDAEFNKMAKYLYDSNLSQEDLIRKVTVFVLEYMEYDKNSDSNNESTCYEHYGICTNYTELEAVLLSKLDIYAITINGYTDSNNPNESYHTWNLVYLNDTWYEIDPTYLDLYDSKDSIESGRNVEYYMQPITTDFKSSHIAYYNYENIPTDLLKSRLCILDKLDEIEDYTPSTVTQSIKTNVDDNYLIKQYIELTVLVIVALGLIVYTIKKKNKKTTKMLR